MQKNMVNHLKMIRKYIFENEIDEDLLKNFKGNFKEYTDLNNFAD